MTSTHTRARRLLVSLAGLAALLGLSVPLAACGGSYGAAPVVAVAPAAYGENGFCYYDDDPGEVAMLVAAGLCPAAWRPMLMPDLWRATYFAYYSSPAYYDSYVPVARRTVYVQHITVWQTSHTTLISQQSKAGRWKGSDGKVTTGAPKNLRTQKAAAPAAGGASQRPVSNLRTTSRNGSGSGSGVKPRSGGGGAVKVGGGSRRK